MALSRPIFSSFDRKAIRYRRTFQGISSSPALRVRWRDVDDSTWPLCLAIQASASDSVANGVTVVG